MKNSKFTVVREEDGWYTYPLPEKSPFSARISLRGLDADAEIKKLAAQAPLIVPSQVHGTEVLYAAETEVYPARPAADGVLFAPGDSAGTLRFGDCAPVLICCIGDTPWLLALHSGFRGTLGNISSHGIAVARERFGHNGKLYAFVGPCISGKCYDRNLDDPSSLEAERLFTPGSVRRGKKSVFIDLKAQIVSQLVSAGVSPVDIFVETQCTCCDTTIFCSHRRSLPGDDPRMLLVVRS